MALLSLPTLLGTPVSLASYSRWYRPMCMVSTVPAYALRYWSSCMGSSTMRLTYPPALFGTDLRVRTYPLQYPSLCVVLT